MNLKNCFLNESNAEESAFENNAIWNFFDSITNFKIQSSEKSKALSSIEVRKTFDEMSKNKCISNEMSMKCALSKNSIEILSKSNKKNLDMIAVVRRTLRKWNASQNTRFVKRAMRKEKSSSNTTFQDVDESSLFRFKNRIADYENLESRDVIQNVFKQDSTFKTFSLKLQSVFKILQEIDFLVVWIRSLIQKALMKQRKNEDDRKI